jgi:hypothetical protein
MSRGVLPSADFSTLSFLTIDFHSAGSQRCAFTVFLAPLATLGLDMRVFKFWLTLLAGVAVVVSAFVSTRAATQAPPIHLRPANGVQPISLRDRLIVGLEARLKSEIAFCDKVVLQVHLGHLPVRIVNETFFWARQRSTPVRNGIQYRPIIYFQPALIARAKRLNLTL